MRLALAAFDPAKVTPESICVLGLPWKVFGSADRERFLRDCKSIFGIDGSVAQRRDDGSWGLVFDGWDLSFKEQFKVQPA